MFFIKNLQTFLNNDDDDDNNNNNNNNIPTENLTWNFYTHIVLVN
jgi:hypothetical protein